MQFSWTDYFDRIFCIHYVGYAERETHITQELSRIGVLSSGIFEWRYTFPNQFERDLAQRLRVPSCSMIGQLFIETKRIIAESRFKGYKRILIIQDDVVFLKDIDKLQEIVSRMPHEANCIQYEKRTDLMPKRISKLRQLEVTGRINEHYLRADGNIFWGGGCYGLTQEGMRILDAVMTKDLINEDNCFAQIPYYVIATQNLCIQRQYKNSEKGKHGYDYNRDEKELDAMGLKKSDYQDI